MLALGIPECRLRNSPPKVRIPAPHCCVTLGDFLNLHVWNAVPLFIQLWWELSGNTCKGLGTDHTHSKCPINVDNCFYYRLKACWKPEKLTIMTIKVMKRIGKPFLNTCLQAFDQAKLVLAIKCTRVRANWSWWYWAKMARPCKVLARA